MESFLLAPCPSDSTCQPLAASGPEGFPPFICVLPAPGLPSAAPLVTQVAFSKEWCLEMQCECRVCSLLLAVIAFKPLQWNLLKYLEAEGRFIPILSNSHLTSQNLLLLWFFLLLSFLECLVSHISCSLILLQLFIRDSTKHTDNCFRVRIPKDNCRSSNEKSLRFLCSSTCP